jgi:ankyrin repeat protein
MHQGHTPHEQPRSHQISSTRRGTWRWFSYVLLRKGANVNAMRKNGTMALHSAAMNGHEAVVRLLLEKGANVNAKAGNGAMALHSAALNGREAAVKLWFNNGVNANAKISPSLPIHPGLTALDMAISKLY